MIIPLDKLVTYNENRYIFANAVMEAVEKVGNMSTYPEDDMNWKVVPNTLNLMLDDKIHFIFNDNVEVSSTLVE